MAPTLLSIVLFGVIAVAAVLVGLALAWRWHRRRRWPLLLAAAMWIGYGLWQAVLRWTEPSPGSVFAGPWWMPALLLFVALWAWRASRVAAPG